MGAAWCVRATVMILVSCMHPKDVISKVYPNYTKTDKIEGLIVVSEGPKLLCHEEKVVVVFCHTHTHTHTPKDPQTEEFNCWAIHQFLHVTEEGSFSMLNDAGDDDSGTVAEEQQNPNNTTDAAQTTNETVPKEIQCLLDTTAHTLTDTDLIRNMKWLIMTINRILSKVMQ